MPFSAKKLKVVTRYWAKADTFTFRGSDDSIVFSIMAKFSLLSCLTKFCMNMYLVHHKNRNRDSRKSQKHGNHGSRDFRQML